MSDNHMMAFSATHILGAIGFEAKRIAAVVDHCAMGGPFPKPDELKAAIERMANMTETLVKFSTALPQNGAHAQAESAMTAKVS